MLFATLIEAWVCCPARRTITGMLTLIDTTGPIGRAAHDAYHRLLRAGAWSMTRCWKSLGILVVRRFAPTGDVPLQVDDILFHKSGAGHLSRRWCHQSRCSTGASPSLPLAGTVQPIGIWSWQRLGAGARTRRWTPPRDWWKNGPGP